MIHLMKSLKMRRNRPAWLVLAAGLAVTWLAWSEKGAQNLKLAEREFNLRVDHMADAINARLHQNRQILLGGAGLFDSSDDVSRTEWQVYIERLQLAQNYPGIQGVGFSRVIRPPNLQAHTAAVQAEGFPDYIVHPVGPRPLYTSVVYLEPFVASNRAAFGFDMMSEAIRGAAMRRAAETGQTTISGKVTLVQESMGKAQSGFMMYVPIYDKHLPLTTTAERWAALAGFVYSPYRVEDLMQGILSKRLMALSFVILDGPDEKDGACLFSTFEVKGAAPDRVQQTLTTTRTLSNFGHSWVIRFHNDPGLEYGVQSSAGLGLLVLGSTISVLLFLMVSFLITRREQAQAIAQQMTLELQTLHAQRLQEAEGVSQTMLITLYERDRHQQAVNAHAIVSVTDGDGNITYVNDKFCAVSGYGRDELIGQNHCRVKSDTHSAEFYADMRNTLARGDIWSSKICNRRADGQLWWVEMTIVPFMDANGLPYQYISISNDITQLKRNEEALQISEEHFRRGQVGANLGTWDWNILTGDVFWSERVGPLLGYAPGQLESTLENHIKATHPSDRQPMLDAIEACVEHDTPYNMEYRVVWPDGTLRWLLAQGAVARDITGKAENMTGVVQDIHERKMIQLALAESEDLLQQAQAMAHLGHWKVSALDRALQCSPEVYQIFGRDPNTFQLSIVAYLEAVHPDDRTLVNDSLKRSGQTGLFELTHRIIRPDGSVRHLQQQVHSQRNSDGKLLETIGTVQDITDYVEAKQQLYDSEARFAFAVEGAGDGIWDWSIGTGEMLFSGNYEGMLGYNKGTLVPRAKSWCDLVHPDDSAWVLQRMEDYLADKVSAFVVEYRLRCKDGSFKWVLCRGTVVARDEGHQPVRMIGIHSDISAQKKLQSELEVARKVADHANQAKSDFLSSMSHELRTPMNAILGFAQLMQYDSTLPEDHQDNVHEIIKGGLHLLELINEVLDLGKVESGTVSLSLEAVALADLVEKCQSLMRPLLATSQITLRVSVPPSAAVRADRTRLKQVLLNLLSNAIKYNRQGGEVSLDVQPGANQCLRISVTDTGIGIAAKDMEKLFEPFIRLGIDHHNVEGTGIGLTITRRLIDLMGGEIGVDSQLGVGSTFWIELPVQALAVLEVDKVAAMDEGEDEGEGAHGTLRRVLCIDDNPTNINLVTKLFKINPHIELLTAHTPSLGIELAQAHKPELILLDINMPGMNGYQVLKIFQADAGLKSVPVIAVSANAMPRDIERGLAAGFADYLIKPLDVDIFGKAVARCLSNNEERN